MIGIDCFTHCRPIYGDIKLFIAWLLERSGRCFVKEERKALKEFFYLVELVVYSAMSAFINDKITHEYMIYNTKQRLNWF